MTQSRFEGAIPSDIRTVILDGLSNIETRENVRILFAIESGSRAWGFPSPDSDFDVRFVYARPLDWYLSLTPGRDVIELPIEGELDINGWDIQKALGLLLKPNPVLLEWLSSPIRYRWEDDVCDRLIAFSQKVAHNRACIYHYLGLGKRQYKRFIEGKDQVALKKYFYQLRPAMALRWVRLHPDTIPPMNFLELMEGVDLPAPLSALIHELLEKKRLTKEMGKAPRIDALDRFILGEFEAITAFVAEASSPGPGRQSEADALFRAIVKEAA